MSTVNLKYSWFLSQKGTNKSKRMRIKYIRKYNNVNKILINAGIYGINLSEDIKNQIQEKTKFYSRQIRKLHEFEYMFKDGGKNKAIKYIEVHFTKQEIDKYKTKNGLLKILRKIF